MDNGCDLVDSVYGWDRAPCSACTSCPRGRALGIERFALPAAFDAQLLPKCRLGLLGGSELTILRVDERLSPGLRALQPRLRTRHAQLADAIAAHHAAQRFACHLSCRTAAP